MARENILFQEGNFTSDGTYYYSMLDGSQVLQQKVDDGSVAFTFPLDTTIPGNIKEIEWDGVYFWTLEGRTGNDGVTIRKWGVESFICKQQQKFEFIDGATHTYDVDSFALENYRLTVGVNHNDIGGGEYTKGAQDIHVSDNSMLEPGDVLTFVRRYTSSAQRVGTAFVEQGVVQNTISGSSTQVRLTAAMTGDPHGDGRGFRGPDITPGASSPPTPDLVYVTKSMWLANDNSPGAPGTPSLYKVRSSNGSNLVQFSGSQYQDINGMASYIKMNMFSGTPPYGGQPSYPMTVVSDSSAGGLQTYMLLARGSVLLFFNFSTNVIDRSLVMNNIKTDTINHWPVYDMWVGGQEPNVVLYRLQLGTTYKNQSLVLTDESWSEYNYEKQLLRRVVNSIAITAEPSILPADDNATSKLTAILRDQYNDLVPSGKVVNWSEDSGDNRLLDANPRFTDEFGRSTNQYQAGTTEQDIKITASVTNGLI